MYTVLLIQVCNKLNSYIDSFASKPSVADKDPNLTVTLFFCKVDDVLETKLGRQFQLVMDKGTLDAIGLHPDGPVKR